MKPLSRAIRALLAGSMLAGAVGAQAANLSIYWNNDGESALLQDGDVGGIAQFVGTLNALRATDTNDILTLSAGDNIFPGPTFDAGYQDQALTAIGYDGIGIGNHDFDQGPDNLATFISDYNAAGGTAPWLNATLDFSGESNLQNLVNTGKIAKRTIVDRDGQKYGIIGSVTEQLPSITSTGNVQVIGGASFASVVSSVQAEIDDLITNQGVNKIIVVSHGQGIEADRNLAAALSGVDVMISGGGDNLLANAGTDLNPGDVSEGVFPNTVKDASNRDVVLVSTSGQYDYIGKLEVSFDASGEVINPTSGATGEPIRINAADGRVIKDPDVFANIESPTAEYVAAALRTVAETEVLLDARSNSVRAREEVWGNVISDAIRDTAAAVISGGSTGVDGELPLIGIMNGGGIRENKIFADTDPGTEPDEFVSELDVRQVLPFGNELAVVKEVSTQQLVNFLENAVSKVVNADTTGGLDPQRQGSGTGRFAQVSGLSFTYNLNGTALVLDTETINKDAEGNDVSGTARTFEVLQAGNRVRNITLEDGTVLFQNGEIVTDTLLNIAMLNFSAEGGDQYFWDFEQSVELLGVEDDEMLLNYMTNVLGLNGKISMAEYGVLGERIQVSAVPVPAALPLFLGAIGALAAFGRRRANNA